MSWNWNTAVDNARELAEAAGNFPTPEKHVLGLAKAIKDLCDAVDFLADKAGVKRPE